MDNFLGKVPVIALDGQAGTGKTEVCKRVAKKFGYHTLFSGGLYRGVGLICNDRGITLEQIEEATEIAKNLDIKFEESRVILEGKDRTNDIKSELGSKLARQFSQIQGIRMALRQYQLDMRKFPGLVAEGRDMAELFPDAIKFYLTADPRIRAERRSAQLAEIGQEVNFEHIFADIIERDRQDTGREHSPLRQHADARLIDTGNKTIEEVVELVCGFQ